MEEPSRRKAEEPAEGGTEDRPEESKDETRQGVGNDSKRSPPEGRWDPRVHAERRWRNRSDEPASR